MRLAKITYYNLLSFLLFFGVILTINHTIPDVPVPYRQIVAVSLLYTIIYSMVFVCWWWITSKELFMNISGLLSFIVVFYLIKFSSYPLIYKVLPRFNVVFHDPSYEFNMVEFQTRIFNSTLFILVFSAAMVMLFRFLMKNSLHRKSEVQRKKLIDQIERLQQRVSTKHLSPHFIKNVMAAVMGSIAIKNDLAHIDLLTKFCNLMHYAIGMQEDDKVVSWNQEWEQVENLLELAKICSGEKSVITKIECLQLQVEIPIGLLLMPIENALKYGSISEKTPLHVKVVCENKNWSVTVYNHFAHQKRDVIASTNSGYMLMQRCIDLGKWPIELDRVEHETCFTATIIGKYCN